MTHPMHSTPRRRGSAWLVALALSATGLAAFAQPAPGPQGGPGMHMHGPMAERHERMQGRRLDELKGRLQLTAAQEGAWTTYMNALQARPAHAAQHEQQHQDLMTLSTPERIERMKSLRAQHQGEMNAFMDRRGEATKTFYAALTPEQKKVFDAETARMMPMHGGPGERHEHRHGDMPGGRS